MFNYNVCGHALPTADSALDLGVLRCTNLSYDEHCINLIKRANRTCAYILRNFVSRNATFMSRLFVAYVRPILEYACPVWSPQTVNLINRVESVQRWFTKRIRSISNLSYTERLTYLGLQRLESRRLYLDLLFLFKLKCNLLHLNINDFSLHVSRLHIHRFISVASSSRSYCSFFLFYVLHDYGMF
jgi:hypothetical protein